MKRAFLLVVVVAFATLPIALSADPRPELDARNCLDFASFCDGLELSEVDGVMFGLWVSYNCAGALEAMSGEHDTNDGGRVLCGDDGIGTCDVSGSGVDWGFVIPELTMGEGGRMDMYQSTDGGRTWELWIGDLQYIGTPGPCLFGEESPLGPSTGAAIR